MPDYAQIAYAAYCRVTYGAAAHPADYHTLTWGQRAAWEAAAAAVQEALAQGQALQARVVALESKA